MPFPYFHLDETEVLRYNYIRIHAEINAHAKCIRSFPVMIGEKDPDAATQRFCALTASYADGDRRSCFFCA